jgi:hypothetical protein
MKIDRMVWTSPRGGSISRTFHDLVSTVAFRLLGKTPRSAESRSSFDLNGDGRSCCERCADASHAHPQCLKLDRLRIIVDCEVGWGSTNATDEAAFPRGVWDGGTKKLTY